MKGFYILGGYPDIKTFEKGFTIVQKYADFVEVGLAYNDPVADGPVIAKAAAEISGETKLEEILDIVKQHKKTKIYVMTYANIFYQFGLKRFSDEYSDIIDGVIVADLPNRLHNFFYDKGFYIPIIPFVTPESRIEDIKLLKNSKADFIYFVGVRGVTGSSVDFLSSELVKKVQLIKEVTNKKVVFGFGIKTKEDTEKVLSYADGFVIGTEIVKRQNQSEKLKGYVESF